MAAQPADALVEAVAAVSEGETPRERRLRQKRESETRRRQNRREDVLAQKRAEGQRNREEYRRRQQEWRAANPDAHRAQKDRVDPVKVRARRAARNIPLGPCARCGTTQDVHRHHPDHSKPLDVVLLCRTHHAEEHARVGA